MPAYYHNETLFSEIYLEEIARQPEQDEVLISLKTLRDYREYAKTGSLADWQESYIHAVLASLGFNARSEPGHLSLLFPLGAAETPVSACFTVLPDEDLNRADMGFNWSEKVIRALRDRQLSWGLLTNGRQWRIVHVAEPTPYETYLQIDLDRILTDQAKDAYQIFHKFMKAENFAADAAGRCQFDRYKKESQDKIDYIEKELANALKQREEGGKGVLSDICMGYVAEQRQNPAVQLDLDSEADRKLLYHSAMLYMFRLLFLFYADARGLLSAPDHAQLAEVRALCLGNPGGAATQHGLWQRLAGIFVNIDQTYNGGLFSPQESQYTRFIDETRISDLYLMPVLHHLTIYRERSGQATPISYRDMSVRHLGTLYEGLLEHKLFIAAEDTEVRLSKGSVQFVPVSQGGRLLTGHFIRAGEVYFGSDPSERKSTGSYYTPEYIVDYIVKNTVGEKLKALESDFQTAEAANWQALARALDETERASLAALLAEHALAFVQQRVLALSILDPAMGSGHFLVNAANLVTNFIVNLLNTPGLQGAAPTHAAHWRRRVVENCIYGVDLNPLAVELAKLSLWILSMALERPLSFINHHLKCGNSLIGARLEEVGTHPFPTLKKAPHQLALFERDPDFKSAVEAALNRARQIAARGSNTMEDVEAKKAWLAEMESALAGYKIICDLHTSLFFGNQIDEDIYQRIVKEKNFALAQSMDVENSYFHWELEFPEPCISNGGFTCIVCNPPYDTFRENEYFKKEPAAGCGNLFGHFITKAVTINQELGSMGFVVPLSFACGSSYENVRQSVYQNYQSLYASHYSKRPNMLFDGVQQRITIFIAHAKESTAECQLYSSKLWRWKKIDQEGVVQNPELAYVDHIFEGVIPKIGNVLGAHVYRRIKRSPRKLGSLYFRNGSQDYVAYYHSVAMYWIKAYDFLPYFKRDKDLAPSASTKLKALHFGNQFDKNLFLLLVNSSLFYYWWIAQGDEFDVLMNEIENFGIYGYETFHQNQEVIASLVGELMEDFQRNSVIKSTSLGGSRAYYQEFYPRKSRQIINRLDDFIAPIYGLTEEQNQFLKEYDLVWRTDEEKEE